MGRIGVAVQETDRHRLNALVLQFLDCGARRVLVEGLDHAVGSTHAFIDLAAQVARNQGVGLLPGNIV